MEYSGSSLALALALLLVWGVMSVALAYDQRLEVMNDSFTQRLMLVGRLGVVLEALDHLAVDQQAFLATGDENFQDCVVESVESLELNLDLLNSLGAKNGSHGVVALRDLSRSIKRVIGIVAESDRIRDWHSKAAAVDYFAAQGDDVSQAKWQVNQLQIDIIRSISHDMKSADTIKTLVGTLLDYEGWRACCSIRLYTRLNDSIGRTE